MYEFGEAGGFKPPSIEPMNGFFPVGLAVGSLGEFYAADGSGAVDKLGPSGGVLGRVFAGAVKGLAVAPSSNELYVDTAGSTIADISPQCEPSGEGCAPVQVFGAPQLSGAAGLAVDTAGTVYAANTGVDQVAVLAIMLEVNPSPGSASEVTATTATLNGEVNPEGSPVERMLFRIRQCSGIQRRERLLACRSHANRPPRK